MNEACVPEHLGIILDGNRRWAKEKGLITLEGHKKGLETAQKIIGLCKNKGVKILTLFVFSTENWKRSEEEINYLQNLGLKLFKENAQDLARQGIKIRIIGQRDKLPANVIEAIEKTEEATKNNTEMTLNFALSYGGRTEIVEAVKNIIKKGVNPDNITEDTIRENLWTTDVDLVIRTGKEQRISNFLIWQAAYSEFLFVPKYWPDFSEKDLDEAFSDYANRQRRFGK